MSTPKREPAGAPRRSRLAMILGLSAAAAVLLLSAIGISLLLSAWRVREEIDKIRSEGQPVTAAEIDSHYSLPPGSVDSTDLWLAAIEAVSRDEYKADSAAISLLSDANGKIPEPGEPWPEQAAAEQFLAKHGDLLATVREAASTGGAARYPTQLPYDNSTTLKPFRGAPAIGRLLSLESEIHARQGDAHAAAVAIDTLLALAKSFDGEPMLVAVLVRISIDDVALDCLRRLMATHELSDGDLAAIGVRFNAINYHSHLHQAMLGARVACLRTFDHPETLAGAVPSKAALMFFGLEDRAVYLRLMHEVVAASAASDPISWQSAMEDTQERILATFESPSANWKYPIAKHLLQSMRPWSTAVGRGTALRDVANTALAAERFRRARGRLPHALDDLAPNFLPRVPLDPFDGALLRWVVTDDDYRIYSIGQDGVDQGGASDEPAPAHDIVFRVPLRKKATTP